MKIVGVQKSSFIDYPGMVSTVLFLSGCNLRCPYCHNAGVVNDRYEAIPFDDIRSHLVKRRGVIEGVVISGGEPSIHEGLKELCGELRPLELKIKIDTNGLEPDMIERCAPDYLALDVKTSFDSYHRLNIRPEYHDHRDRLRRSINIVKSMKENAEVRITAAPGIVDTGDIETLVLELKGVHKIFIQQFEPIKEPLDPSYADIKPYEAHVLDNWRKIFENAGISCALR